MMPTRFTLHHLLLRLACAVAVAICAATTASAQPKHEMRGAWLVTAYGIDWPSKAGTSAEVVKRQKSELDSIIGRLARSGVNAIFFQVRPMADAFYVSEIEPTSSFLTGRRGAPLAFDPLEHAVAACHRLGVECHAWINPFRVGTSRPSTALDNKSSRLWMTNRVKRAVMTIFNPGLAATRHHLCRVVADIATRYDVDGIVFDDYFYNPEFLPEDESAADWDVYRRSGTQLPIDRWRRENIDEAIREVHLTLDSIKEGKVRFGVSPQGIGGGNGAHAEYGVPSPVGYGVVTADSQYAKIYSDPVSWLRQGLVDYISPQVYWRGDNPRHPFDGLARWWNDVAALFGRHCYVSQSLVALASDASEATAGECRRQVDVARHTASDGAPGAVLYSSKHITGSGLGKSLRDSLYATAALMPAMTWKADREKPLTVESLVREGNRLKWEPCGDARYVVYALPSGVPSYELMADDGDGLSPRYIIGITYRPSFLLEGDARQMRIAVAPYDRYGNEWAPTFLAGE